MINKEQNQNLQITLSKESIKNLDIIKAILKLKFNIEFTKSKIIEFLIREYIKNQK